jgi:hypothetical protein
MPIDVTAHPFHWTIHQLEEESGIAITLNPMTAQLKRNKDPPRRQGSGKSDEVIKSVISTANPPEWQAEASAWKRMSMPTTASNSGIPVRIQAFSQANR